MMAMNPIVETTEANRETHSDMINRSPPKLLALKLVVLSTV